MAVVSEVKARFEAWKNRGFAGVPLPFAKVFEEFRPERKAFVVNVALPRATLALNVDEKRGFACRKAGVTVNLTKNMVETAVEC